MKNKQYKRWWRGLLTVLLLAILPVIAWAQIGEKTTTGSQGGDFTVITSVIGGGGAGWESGGGDFAKPGTIGQPYGRIMTGGDFTFATGFWHVYCAPGTVSLTPAITGTRVVNDVVIDWAPQSANDAGTEIWRDQTNAYFQPVYPPHGVVHLPASVYTDTEVITGTPGGIYYVTTGLNKCSDRSAPSNRVGFFTYSLIPGES